jgi:carbamate kinase
VTSHEDRRRSGLERAAPSRRTDDSGSSARNVKIAAAALAEIQPGNELVITHGNGPQVGLLALQGAAYKPDEAYPLDVLGAETEGMIGYMIEQELGNLLPFEVPFATILTMVEVDRDDPGFKDPTKFVGPVYSEAEAKSLASEKGWTMKEDGDKWRRVVPSPLPKRIFEIRPIKWLLEKGTVVIAAGGGGIPTVYEPGRLLRGIEAVIDKDLCSELLAREIEAVFLSWQPMRMPCSWIGESPQQRHIGELVQRRCASSAFPLAPWDRRSKRHAISLRLPVSELRSARSRI